MVLIPPKRENLFQRMEERKNKKDESEKEGYEGKETEEVGGTKKEGRRRG